jgi:hypothetical protein
MCLCLTEQITGLWYVGIKDEGSFAKRRVCGCAWNLYNMEMKPRAVE